MSIAVEAAIEGAMVSIRLAGEAVDAARNAPPLSRHERSLESEWAEAVLSEVTRLGRPGDEATQMAEVLRLSASVIQLCAQVDALEKERDFWHDRCEPRLFDPDADA